MEQEPLRATHFENYLLSLPSVQFHPRSLDFSGGTAHTAGNASKPTIPRRPHGPDWQETFAINQVRTARQVNGLRKSRSQ